MRKLLYYFFVFFYRNKCVETHLHVIYMLHPKGLVFTILYRPGFNDIKQVVAIDSALVTFLFITPKH